MSRPPKPTNLLNSNMSKEEKEKREKGEKKLQGDVREKGKTQVAW